MILQKAKLHEPVVLMGETGSGKTYLVKFIAEVVFGFNSIFKSFIFHYGIEDLIFIQFMENVIDEANQESETIFWVFFDEFNTSDLQPFVTELLNDRIFSLSDNPESERIRYHFNQ
jgi:energy-coupling factor transporter ATP-binding protein EcfA2